MRRSRRPRSGDRLELTVQTSGLTAGWAHVRDVDGEWKLQVPKGRSSVNRNLKRLAALTCHVARNCKGFIRRKLFIGDRSVAHKNLGCRTRRVRGSLNTNKQGRIAR